MPFFVVFSAIFFCVRRVKSKTLDFAHFILFYFSFFVSLLFSVYFLSLLV